jgi:hypothetical protein
MTNKLQISLMEKILVSNFKARFGELNHGHLVTYDVLNTRDEMKLGTSSALGLYRRPNYQEFIVQKDLYYRLSL